jgi:hypothetical protein
MCRIFSILIFIMIVTPQWKFWKRSGHQPSLHIHAYDTYVIIKSRSAPEFDKVRKETVNKFLAGQCLILCKPDFNAFPEWNPVIFSPLRLDKAVRVEDQLASRRQNGLEFLY